MKQTIQHETHGEIVYEEGFFSGKKTITVGGSPLEKVTKKQFRWKDGSIIDVKGNYLIGTSINVHGENIQLTPKLKWYEIVLCIFPLLLVLVWGNSVALCRIVPIVGGAIGGAIGGLFTMAGLLAIKSVKPIWLKILVALASLAITFGICALIAYAILGYL